MYLNSPLIFYPDTNVSLTATLMQNYFKFGLVTALHHAVKWQSFTKQVSKSITKCFTT